MDKKIILQEYKNVLENNFPGMIEKVIFFGSQADNSASAYSDYDILVVLNVDYDWQLERKIYDVTYEVDLKNDIVSDIKVISLNEVNGIRGQVPFIVKAINSGIVV